MVEINREERPERFNERLLRLAEYLESAALDVHDLNVLRYTQFVHLYDGHQKTYDILYHYWVFKLFPEIFNEFYLDKDEDEVYFEPGHESDDHVTGVFIYFGLTTSEEFCAIFDAAGNQFTEQFGTKTLSDGSGPREIAFNIRQLVKSRDKNRINGFFF